MTAATYTPTTGERVAHALHRTLVHHGRVDRLADILSGMVPMGTNTVLDVGCGDGKLAAALNQRMPWVDFSGVDVAARPDAVIDTTVFDGRTLPFDDDAFDSVLLVDVVHHADDQLRLLAECARVARHAVILKDHVEENVTDRAVLKAMDYVGNRHSRVPLPYRYPSRLQWLVLFDKAGLEIERWNPRPGVYPAPLTWIIGRDLHAVARLRPRARR